MSGPSKMSFSNPTPDQLHALILDYLCHSCHTRTAAAFSKDNPARQLDADGDEILSDTPNYSGRVGAVLKQVQLREEIRREILSGRVEEAIALLNKDFPSVLAENGSTTTPINNETQKTDSEHRPVMSNLEYVSSTSTEPAHLLLNLRILAFSEACRTIPLKYPPEPGSDPMDSEFAESPMDTDAEIESKDRLANEQQMSLLLKAQKLYALTNMLPNRGDRVTYSKELENVSGLLAYEVPEKSSMAKYLTMERREAVADQINRAILKRTERPLISSLELITRYTTVLWSAANECSIRPRLGAVLPPRGKEDNEDGLVPLFDLQQFLDSKP